MKKKVFAIIFLAATLIAALCILPVAKSFIMRSEFENALINLGMAVVVSLAAYNFARVFRANCPKLSKLIVILIIVMMVIMICAVLKVLISYWLVYSKIYVGENWLFDSTMWSSYNYLIY